MKSGRWRRGQLAVSTALDTQRPDGLASTVARLDETDGNLVRQLFAKPPPDFVAARNELVKGLRRDKRRDEATAIGALRRPGWDEWALNAVAGTDPDVVAAFAEAAAAVREAQTAAIEGRDGPDVRVVLRELRERSAELVSLAEKAMTTAGRNPVIGEVNARLSQAAASDVAVAQLRAGLLGSGNAAPTELFGDVTLVTAGAASRSRPHPRPRKEPTGQATAAPDKAAADAARAERERRREALVEANRAHAAAVKVRHRADAEVKKAEAAAARARAALAEAEEALATAREAAEAAAVEEARRATAVDAAREALEEEA